MTTIPTTRHRQEVEVALEAADSYVRVQLPDGRVAVLYGTGQIKVSLGMETRFHRLPVASDEVPSLRPIVSAAPRRPPRSVPAPAVVPVPAPPPVQVAAGVSGVRFDDDGPGPIRRSR